MISFVNPSFQCTLKIHVLYIDTTLLRDQTLRCHV